MNQKTSSLKEFYLLGIKIDSLTWDDVLVQAEKFFYDERQHYLVTINPEFIVQAQKDKEFKEIINQADLRVIDGFGLVLLVYLLTKGRLKLTRIPGVDLMEKLCQKAAERGWSVYLYGAGEGVAEKAASNLKQKYPDLNIEVWPEEKEFSFFCSFSNPGLLFVALGAPKQEKWIISNLKNLPQVKLALGVGGAFDFLSGEVPRAPRIFRKIGLEWLWRVIIQPWRWKRIFRAVFVFPYLAFKEAFQNFIDKKIS